MNIYSEEISIARLVLGPTLFIFLSVNLALIASKTEKRPKNNVVKPTVKKIVKK